MNKYLSMKLKVISFLLIIMVVYLHSYNIIVNLNTGAINTWHINRGYTCFFENFISKGINQIAVPLFFAISGYLFFFNIQGTRNEFIAKFKTRLRTLVIPYLVWSLWGILLFFILQSLPHTETFFIRELIRNYTIKELLYTIFLHPIPYQLWFILNLIILVLLSPIIYWAIKYFNILPILLFLLAWLCNIDLIGLHRSSLSFFTFGAFFSIKKNKYEQIKFSNKSFVFTCLWITITLIKTILIYVEFQNQLVLIIMEKASILIGIVAIWSLYDILYKNKDWENFKYYRIFSFSFFLFAFHEPILTTFKKVLTFIGGKSEIIQLLVYIVAPLLTIFLGIFIGYILKLITPKLYKVLTGGR